MMNLRTIRVGSLLGFALAISLGVSNVQAQVGGGIPVATNGFEGGETLVITPSGGTVSSDPGASLTPANATIRSGNFSWQAVNENASFDSDFVAIDASSNHQVIVRAASISGTVGNGIDLADNIKIYVALDGAAFSGTPDITLNGNNNARYGFDATEEIQVYAGDAFVTNAPQGGLNLNNFATFGVDIPNAATSVALRVEVLNNSADEYWCLDDIEIQSDVPGWQEPGAPQTNVVFALESDAVNEDVGTYVVTINKTLPLGNVTGELELGGTATEGGGDDYTISATNFTLTGASTSTTVTITINDDVDAESAETITLTLVNVEGGEIDVPSTFTLTINPSDAPASSLFISEVADPGDGTDARFVELYNAGGSAIDLAAGNYYIARQVNGNSSTNNVALTGTVAAASTYVIAQDATVFQSSYPGVDFDQVGSDLDGNGDDAYMLYIGGDSDAGLLIDIYGEFGVDGTGQPWQYENSRAVRTDTVVQANAVWTESEWIIPGSADIADMTPGVHPDGSAPILTNVLFEISADSVNEDVGTYVITVIKTLPEGNVSGEVVLGGDATIGGGNDYTIDTTNFTMNGTTTSATFTVTINDDGDNEAAETITLTLANVEGGTIASPDVFTLTISPSDVPAEGIADFRFNSAPFDQVSVQAANISVSNVTMTTGTLQTEIFTGTYFPDEPYVQSSGGWDVDNQAAAKAFLFTIEPASGYKVSITGISFSAYATGSGPSGYGYDINGGAATFADDMPADTIQHITNAVTGVDDITAPIDILIQGWTNGTRVSSGGGDFRIDDVVIFGLIELVGGGGDTTLDEYDIIGISESGGSFTVTIDVTSNGVPYTLIYSTDLLTDNVPSGTGVADSQTGDGGSITLEDTTPADAYRMYWIDTNVAP